MIVSGRATRCIAWSSANAMLAVSPERGLSRWSDTASIPHPRETLSSPAIHGFIFQVLNESDRRWCMARG
jgi:hypothetical protein